jgi:hypothetical protein
VLGVLLRDDKQRAVPGLPRDHEALSLYIGENALPAPRLGIEKRGFHEFFMLFDNFINAMSRNLRLAADVLLFAGIGSCRDLSWLRQYIAEQDAADGSGQF